MEFWLDIPLPASTQVMVTLQRICHNVTQTLNKKEVKAILLTINYDNVPLQYFEFNECLMKAK